MLLQPEVAPGIHRVEDAHVNWFLVEADGDLTVVDAGLPASWRSLGAALDRTGRRLDDIRALVLTHAHFDHVGFAQRMARDLGVPVYLPEGEQPIAAHPLRYPHARSRLRYVWRPGPFRIILDMVRAGMLRVEPVRAATTYRAGEVLPVPGSPRAVATPGHAPAHVSLAFADRDAVIAGDALVTLDPYTARRGPRVVAAAATADPAAPRPRSRRCAPRARGTCCPATASRGTTGRTGPSTSRSGPRPREIRATDVPIVCPAVTTSDSEPESSRRHGRATTWTPPCGRNGRGPLVIHVSRHHAQRSAARVAAAERGAGGVDERERSYRAAVQERPYLVFLGAELLLWACLYAVYFVVRGQTISGAPEAIANARGIVDFERVVGLAHERSMQDAAQAFGAVDWLLSHYYELGFFPLVIACLVYLTRADRERYRELRAAMLLSIAVALVVFWMVPTAPPRLLPELGIADTVGMQSHDVGSVYGVSYNPYAAMPSMHVGWSILLACVIFAVARRRIVRIAAIAHPVIMSIAVVTTGNHYLVDGVVGAAIAVPVLLLVRRSRANADERGLAGPPRPLPATQ